MTIVWRECGSESEIITVTYSTIVANTFLFSWISCKDPDTVKDEKVIKCREKGEILCRVQCRGLMILMIFNRKWNEPNLSYVFRHCLNFYQVAMMPLVSNSYFITLILEFYTVYLQCVAIIHSATKMVPKTRKNN